MKKVIWIIIIVAVAFGIWALMKQPAQAPVTGDNTDTQHTSTGDDMTPPEPTVSAGVDVSLGTVKNITVTGSNFKFTPSTITVKKGDTVNLTFVNSGGTHDWRLDEFNAATKRINGGAQETITFVASKAGTFEYYCSVGTHRAMGMKGTLTVTE